MWIMSEISLDGRNFRTMKVIFLDFDGVLNAPTVPFIGSTLHRGLRLSPSLIERLNRVVRDTGAKVVLSTSWRPTVKGGPWDVSDVERALKSAGFDGAVVGATRDLGQYLDEQDWLDAEEAEPGTDEAVAAATLRAMEIREWVRRNAPTAFVVLDDDRGAAVEGYFVHVDHKVGLSDQDVESAIAVLMRP